MALTNEELEVRLVALENTVAGIRSCTCDPSKYANQEEFYNVSRNVSTLKTTVANLETLVGTLPEDTEATTVVEYVDEKTDVPEYKLPYTASEVAEKLGKVE